jgi:hypothetical protein
MSARTLAALAVFGTLASLALAAGGSFPLGSRQGAGFFLLTIAAALVVVTIVTLMPASVPLGIYLLVVSLLGLLSVVPVLSVPFLRVGQIPIAKIGLSLSVVFLLGIALHMAYATWATCLILQTVRLDRCEPSRSLAEVPRWFWRVAGLESLCWSVLLIIGGAMLGAAARKGAASLSVMLFLMAVFTVLLNLGTAALLPAALDPRLPYWTAVRVGVSRSWRTKSRWWMPMFAQMLLLGLVTYLAASFDHSDRPGSSSHESTRELKVNGMWLGGYESDCRWYGALTRVLKTPKVPLVESGLNLVFGLLAVAVKLSVVRGLTVDPEVAGRSETERV